MQCKYITTLEDLRSFCIEFKNELSGINGKCQGCIRYGKCLQICKEQHVDAALHMEAAESRFPGLFNFMKSTPALFWCIPAVLYKMTYGSFRDNLSCQFCTGETILDNFNQIEKAFAILTDEQSKLTLINVLMYRLTMESDYILRAYSPEPQYVISPFRHLGKDEVYVDCGAFNGDSFEQYCSFNMPPKKAYLFEPDEHNRQAMENKLMQYRSHTDIIIFDKGVYKSSGVLYFVSGKEMGSHFSETKEEGGINVNVTSIDDAIDDDITFIKMDVEGLEKQAILGAEKRILKNYPKLAICIYHSTKDLWEIPIFINDLFPDYSHFEIRHHTKLFFETVLYVYR